ncbi:MULTISPECIES: hypothetical protein [Burkholderia]|uniref:hypothetical protein n=1 Tax=Burkholderia TaxID=32008 RepID=UPI0013C49BCA|nr:MULTISPECIES: hypothetical protein [Burkholderia]MBY4801309.1 hypothetical protein [Burkholderia cepacia]NTX18178.1 hypothetical protein [Burkholderia cepacia]
MLAQLIARFTGRVFCNPKIGRRFDRDPVTFTATKSPLSQARLFSIISLILLDRFSNKN